VPWTPWDRATARRARSTKARLGSWRPALGEPRDAWRKAGKNVEIRWRKRRNTENFLDFCFVLVFGVEFVHVFDVVSVSFHQRNCDGLGLVS